MSAVLIVDDEALIRWSIAESLEAEGHRIVEASSAKEALARIAADPHIGIVLLDLKLPDSDDLGLLIRLRRLVPHCRIILMTAHGSPEILQQALREGAFNVLGKPFDMRRIVNVVRDAAA